MDRLARLFLTHSVASKVCQNVRTFTKEFQSQITHDFIHYFNTRNYYSDDLA